ncbi:Conserved oligomeric Golgi complex subunit 1 [Portunus trituberculatus]|uniref:Conserved oligomeric Golgi complex subunit 1 n=1 Tax=Portunus trituberculatus TaxID=210409 RepID=A0A5B7GTI6_PORTR|nr:Conserved oligomeric Golgi complex subunit 1 [Portunus trituberculatus]
MLQSIVLCRDIPEVLGLGMSNEGQEILAVHSAVIGLGLDHQTQHVIPKWIGCEFTGLYKTFNLIEIESTRAGDKMASEDEVTLLFEQHSITQVQELLNKTRADIECKKEDLRVMVGERYRDLIEAADTIAEMQNSAKAICNNIKTMEGLCESLQQRGLIGFKTQSTHANGVERLASLSQNIVYTPLEIQ